MSIGRSKTSKSSGEAKRRDLEREYNDDGVRRVIQCDGGAGVHEAGLGSQVRRRGPCNGTGRLTGKSREFGN